MLLATSYFLLKNKILKEKLKDLQIQIYALKLYILEQKKTQNISTLIVQTATFWFEYLFIYARALCSKYSSTFHLYVWPNEYHKKRKNTVLKITKLEIDCFMKKKEKRKVCGDLNLYDLVMLLSTLIYVLSSPCLSLSPLPPLTVMFHSLPSFYKLHFKVKHFLLSDYLLKLSLIARRKKLASINECIILCLQLGIFFKHF